MDTGITGTRVVVLRRHNKYCDRNRYSPRGMANVQQQ